MRRHSLTIMKAGFLILACSTLAACQSMQLSSDRQVADAQQVIMRWKMKPMQVAKQMMVKYGPPDEVTSERLIWHDNGPWKVTEIVNEEIPHSIPKPHTDMLFQSIRYHVPPDFLHDLAFYDGSIIAERTKESSERGATWRRPTFWQSISRTRLSMERTVAEAREFYAAAMREMKHPEYKQGLIFDVATGNQRDRDGEVYARQ